ncbi:MAG: Yip1 family protein [Pseudobdellovibrionaceae bacterium]
MRDVTPPNAGNKNDSSKFRDPIVELYHFVVNFLKHPIKNIAHLPMDWSWTRILGLLMAVSMLSGVLSGLIPPNFYRILGGLLVAPFMAFFLTSLMAVFIYYYFQIFEKRTLDFKQIYILILFADIPFFLFQVASEILPPITLVGFAFTALLLAVGLTENFQLEKQKSLRLIGGLFLVVFLIWLWNLIEVRRLG